jgi:hypothetical protein
MKRRSKAGGKAAKSARHKPATLKRRRTPPRAGRGRSSDQLRRAGHAGGRASYQLSFHPGPLNERP